MEAPDTGTGTAAAAGAAADPPATTGPQELTIRFVGSGSEYFRIWIVNLLLTLVSIGFYHPFAKARRLVYFYGATEVGGQPLSFLGDPWKMLRGHVLMLAMVGSYALAIRVSPVAGIVALAVVSAVWPALWHSSLRFRLANTAWRGLRFRFTGSRLGAYRVLALPTLAVVVALAGAELIPAPPADEPRAAPDASPGLLMALLSLLPLLLAALLAPLLAWSMRRYQHDHYAWGTQACAFTGRLRSFYGAFAVAGLAAAGTVLSVGLLAGLIALGLHAMGYGASGAAVTTVVLVFVGYIGVAGVAGGTLVARLQNLSWNGTRAPDVAFRSALRARDQVRLMLKNGLLIVVTLGLYYPFAAVASARLRLAAVSVQAGPGLLATVATAAQADEAAAGDAAGDFFGVDVGL